MPRVPCAAGSPGRTRLRSSRLLLWLLALAPVICACSARDLWAPDEPRYGQVAREMLTNGEWLVPHVNGAPYAEKPPLYYWGAAALSVPVGRVTAITARLAAALYALGCVFLLVRLARVWFDDRELGITAAALFVTTLLIGWNGSRAGLDLPLTFWILLAVERGYAFLTTGRALPAVVCGLAWCAAILVKGPLGFLFPPLALLAMAIASRRAPRVTNVGWWLMLVALVLPGLLWLLPALEAGGDAYADRLLGQIRGRATGAEGHHLRPPWYFAIRGPAQALPWTLLFIGGAWTTLRLRRAPQSDRAGLAACAVLGVGCLVMLSCFATKREVYMIPLFPFFALAAAYAMHRGTTPGWTIHGTRLATGLAAGVGLSLLLAAFAAPIIERVLPDEHRVPAELMGWPAFAAYAPAGLLFLVGAWRAFRVHREPLRVIRTLVPWMLIGFSWLLLALLPRIDEFKTYGKAARIAEEQAGDGPVYNIGFGQAANLLWSLDRETTEELYDVATLRARLAASRSSVVAGAKWWDRARAADPEATADLREVWRNRRGKLVVLELLP